MRSTFIVALGGAALATIGSVGVVMGRRPGSSNVLAMGIGVLIVAIVGTAYVIRQLAQEPTASTTEGSSMLARPPIGYIKWLAIPGAFIGLIMGFFGLAWGSAVESIAAVGVLAGSAVIWRVFSRNS